MCQLCKTLLVLIMKNHAFFTDLGKNEVAITDVGKFLFLFMQIGKLFWPKTTSYEEVV